MGTSGNSWIRCPGGPGGKFAVPIGTVTLDGSEGM